MDMFLNIGMAKISLILTFALCVIYVLRVLNKNYFKNKIEIVKTTNEILRGIHKEIGVLLIITGLIHGVYSSDAVISLNMGTVCWIFSILLGLNWMFKRFYKKTWIKWHRALTVMFLITLGIHLIQVKELSFVEDKASNEEKIKVEITSEENREEIKNKIESEDKKEFEESKETEKKQIENSLEQENDEKNTEQKEAVSIDENIETEEENSNTEETSKYKDGVYQGVARGYREGLKVEVTVENGDIKSVDVVEHYEGRKWFNRVVPKLTNEIVETQSVELDTITGATRTSNGILNAVKNALSIE